MLRPARRLLFVPTVILLLTALLGACAGKGPREDFRESTPSPDNSAAEVLARVNCEAVIRAELDSFVRRSALENKAAELRRDVERDPDLRRRFLQELVVRRMILQWADKLGIAVSESEIDEGIRRGTDASGKFLLQTTLLEDSPKTDSRADFRQSVQEELREAKVFSRLAQEGAVRDETFTELSFRDYYAAHRERFKGTYADERDRIELQLRIDKRHTDHRQLALFLFRRSEVTPGNLAEFR
jgi:hypothetical protein